MGWIIRSDDVEYEKIDLLRCNVSNVFLKKRVEDSNELFRT